MNSKLEKFGHEMNTLWKLSGSSLGALRELVAVAGILCVKGSVAILHNLFGMLHWHCSLPNYVSIPNGLKIQY